MDSSGPDGTQASPKSMDDETSEESTPESTIAKSTSSAPEALLTSHAASAPAAHDSKECSSSSAEDTPSQTQKSASEEEPAQLVRGSLDKASDPVTSDSRSPPPASKKLESDSTSCSPENLSSIIESKNLVAAEGDSVPDVFLDTGRALAPSTSPSSNLSPSSSHAENPAGEGESGTIETADTFSLDAAMSSHDPECVQEAPQFVQEAECWPCLGTAGTADESVEIRFDESAPSTSLDSHTVSKTHTSSLAGEDNGAASFDLRAESAGRDSQETGVMETDELVNEADRPQAAHSSIAECAGPTFTPTDASPKLGENSKTIAEENGISPPIMEHQPPLSSVEPTTDAEERCEEVRQAVEEELDVSLLEVLTFGLVAPSSPTRPRAADPTTQD